MDKKVSHHSLISLEYTNNSIHVGNVLTGTTEFPLRDAPPGDIVSSLENPEQYRHITPVGDKVGSRGLTYMRSRKVTINGVPVPCFYLESGIFIRQDDVAHLKKLFLDSRDLKKDSEAMETVPESVLRVGVRAIWPGQSYGAMLKLGGKRDPELIPLKDLPIFHVRRVTKLVGM